MKQHGFKKLLFALFLVWTSLCIITPAALALDETTLSGIPGAEQWQPYLEQSPVSISDFADAPLDALKKLFHGSMAAALQETLRGSTDALLFLLLAALLSFLTSETTNGELLDLIAAGGCGVLLWSKLLTLAEQLCAQMGEWRGFLLGFLPVYAGVLTMGGETAAGSAASGFFSDDPLLSGAVPDSICPALAAMLSGSQHGLLHQHRSRACRFLPKHRRFAAPGTSLGGEVSGTFAGVAAGYSIAAGPCRAPHRPASDRERPHCRADFERCFRSVSRRNPALEKRPRPCGHCVSWGGIFPAVSRHDAPAGSFVRMQPVLQPDREHPL